jgi:hypothetical protein
MGQSALFSERTPLLVAEVLQVMDEGIFCTAFEWVSGTGMVSVAPYPEPEWQHISSVFSVQCSVFSVCACVCVSVSLCVYVSVVCVA